MGRSRTENTSSDSLIDPAQGLVLCVLALLLVGLVFVYSASYVWALAEDQISDGQYIFRRQFLYVLVSLLLMVVASHVPVRFWRKGALPLYMISIVLLGLVLVPGIGTEFHGARRWIRMGGIGFQPSELAKLSVILITAWYATGDTRIQTFVYGFLGSVILVCLPAALIMLEPDLGTGVFVWGLGMLVALAGGMRLTYFVPASVVTLPSIAAVLWVHFAHFRERIMVFLNPGSDPLGTGHQIRQSLIALGSGGLFGRGIGRSVQKLFFLPQQKSDFIFSVIGEEVGFLGTSVLVLLFLGIGLFGLQIADEARSRFGRLLAIGITVCVCLQAALNMAVATASMPTKGMPLPFVSFGGSSMVVSALMMGLLIAVHREEHPERNRTR